MTCPVADRRVSTTDDGSAETVDVVERFKRVTQSVFVGLFAAGFYDQAMLPAVSAALEDTGRIRNEPWARALRTAAADQIFFAGDETDRRAEAARLMRLHRDVKGVGADGVRYSALNPETWNFITYSTFFVHRNAFVAITGDRLSGADDQAIWDHYRQLGEGLQLPGRSRLIEDYAEMSAHYDAMVAEKLESTTILACAVDYLVRPARPRYVPAPLWTVTGSLGGHALAVLGFGIMHPGVRALVPMTWTPLHDAEFAVMTTGIRLAYQCLPTWLTDTPLARNRRQYQRLIARYQGIGLTSFAPGPGR